MRKLVTALNFIIIFAVGFFLRFINITPFKIYPDSYQSLIVAKNITDFGSVLGILGENGVYYPPYIIWSRPGYPLLINIVELITKNAQMSAQFISFAAGMAGIIAAFFLTRTIFSSNLIALSGAALLALSFNHVIWGGFIMTETLGVLALLVLFLLVFKQSKRETKVADPQDLATGLVFGFAVLTRYEYILVAIPLFFLLYTNKNSTVRILNISAGFLIVASLALFFIFPPSTIGEVAAQLQHILERAALIIGGIIFFAVLFLINRNYKIRVAKILPKFVLIAIFAVLFYFILQNYLPLPFPLPAFSEFLKHDFALAAFFFVGIFLMLKKKEFQTAAYFSLLGILVLLPVYQRINPTMERYFTHLLPFLIIPAAVGLSEILKQGRKNKFLITMVLAVFSYQIFVSFWGLRTLNNGSWTRVNYYDRVASQIKTVEQDEILLVSFPEPYFLATGNSTQGTYDEPPFIHLDESFNSFELLIVNDMGMWDVFPNFALFLDKNLSDYKTSAFRMNEKYHYQARVEDEKYPVEVYKISVGDLREKISSEVR